MLAISACCFIKKTVRRFFRGLLFRRSDPTKITAWSKSYIQRFSWYRWIGIKPEDVEKYLNGKTVPPYDPRDYEYLAKLDEDAKMLGFRSAREKRKKGFGWYGIAYGVRID